MSLITENTFETALVSSLILDGGYELGNAGEYSKDLGLFINEIISFLQNSQPGKWEKIKAIHGLDVEKRIIQRLFKELDLRGSLDILRNGFVDFGVRFQMAFFKPTSGLNPDAQVLYQHNRLKVYRQLFYSSQVSNSIDVVIAINGIPVSTLELKNQFTGQNVNDALRQYGSSRDNRELIFAFKKRTIVHFAVDQDEVFMTTKLEGPKTYWLPFNKGYNQGKGNPINLGGYRTAYLWEEILQMDSWMEIIQMFVHLQSQDIENDEKIYKRERLIFPRYHQLDAIRKISSDILENGIGKNYLIQHSAGSGKSNSIAWLSYRLSSLHNSNNERVYDSIIVITDRRVLDQQLQSTIYQFEHKSGVVQKIDKDSNQLALALGQGINIIITTLQKFPYVVATVGTLPNRKYAVIIDEAHSSQGGEASKTLKDVLSNKIENPLQTMEDDDFNEYDRINEEVERSATARGKQQNISFFAFTATPKYRTLMIFGEKQADGAPKPFHLYAMRQAIEEGFILDVLGNYTTYELYFKLTKAIEEDPQFNRKKAAQAIGKYVSLHPHNLSQKTEIIIEHFSNIVSKKIGGRAKAMLVCGSRLQAKRYYEEFGRYILTKGYENDIKVLVAFSGRIFDGDTEGVSESDLNGYGERELPKVFEQNEYKILIVADKYQTGFDQPLLQTMYIDKKLSGVKAVQTLSRLNRTYPGKEDTFVLDFVNERATILDSFQPYYEITQAVEEPDINLLYDLKARMDTFQIYWEQEIEGLARIYFNPDSKINQAKEQKMLYAYTDPAVQRFNDINEDKQDEFKKGIRTWTNLYAFISQIMPFTDTDFEKFYAYAKLLQIRLPKRDLSESLQLYDELALEYYRLQKIKEGAIELEKNTNNSIQGATEAGLKQGEDEERLLSEIINVLNDRFGTEFEQADKLFFDQIETELLEDEKLQKQAKVNKMDTFKYAFEDIFIEKLIGRMDQNQEIFEKVLEDKEFGDLIKELMIKKIYRKLNLNS
jgi:type I restriction enzyme R subunit